MILYTVLIILALLILAVLFTKISIIINAEKPLEDSLKVNIRAKVLWLKIDLLRFLKRNKKAVKTENEQTEDLQEKKDDFSSWRERLYNIRINIARGKYTYLLSKKYVCKKIKIDYFDFNMTFGLDDAAHTGIATGAVWGGLYNVFGFLSSLCTIKSHKFNITPFFEGECFSFKFSSKIRFSVFNIIAISFAVMINYFKSKRKIKF